MKKKNIFLTIMSIAWAMISGCSEKKNDPVPIAPIIKEVAMPAESNSIPGTKAIIKGKGFDFGDVLFCKSLDGEIDFTPKVLDIDDYSISIFLPLEACGNYEVSVTRKNKTTILSEKLYVAYIIFLEDIVLPSGIIPQESEIEIKAKGLKEGDIVEFESASYPIGVSVKKETTYSEGKLKLKLPSSVYGKNLLKILRGKRIGKLGSLDVGVELYASIGGGVVFYTSEQGLHGLIVHPAPLGEAAMTWGPAVPSSFAGGTSEELYKGKSNSEALLKQIKDTKDTYNYPHATPVELCSQLESVRDDIKYDDWFLPSLKELEELFKARKLVETQGGFVIPNNNYWSSTETDYSGGWVWAMKYFNFYEATNIVTGDADRVNWAIGTMAVRQF